MIVSLIVEAKDFPFSGSVFQSEALAGVVFRYINSPDGIYRSKSSFTGKKRNTSGYQHYNQT